MLRNLLKYNLCALLLPMLFLPGALYLFTTATGKELPQNCRFDYRLTGTFVDTPKKKLTLNNFKRHYYQKYIEETLTSQFPLRSLFIRLNNQFFYMLKKSYVSDGQLVIGKSNQLFTQQYIYSYCGQYPERHVNGDEANKWADDIKKLNDYFTKHGQTFVYVISPSKAGYMPENIPARFHCKQKGDPAYIGAMVKALEERKIPYVNAQALMRTGEQQYKIPMFPRGGIHWNAVGANLAVNEIISEVNKVGFSTLKPVSFTFKMEKPEGSDRDLLTLLNLKTPNTHYKAPNLVYTNPIKNPKDSLAFIGGSFSTMLSSSLTTSGRFKDVYLYSYFKLKRFHFTQTNMEFGPIDPDSKQWLHDVQSAKVVILEENAEITGSTHGKMFFDAMHELKLV